MKRILFLVLTLLMICLPVFAAKGSKAAVPTSSQVQIFRYPAVTCAVSVPIDWSADIDENNVMFLEGAGKAIVVWANPKATPFDSLAQLDDQGKINFAKQMMEESARDKKNYKLTKNQFITLNDKAAYELECSYTDPDSNNEVYNHNYYVVKERKLLMISGFGPYTLAEISNLNNILSNVGF